MALSGNRPSRDGTCCKQDDDLDDLKTGPWGGETLQDRMNGTRQAGRGPSGLPWDVQAAAEPGAVPGAVAVAGVEPGVRDLDNGPTPQERAILRLMLAGVRDEAIARDMGVSIRTFRRNLATLMSKIGAENRFQAGVKASAKGWL